MCSSDLDTSVGAQPYGGLAPTNQTVVAARLPAHIQADSSGPGPTAKLPGDAAGESVWKIIFKAPRSLVHSRDFIVDDLGNTYQVISASWGPLVTTCRCQIMET